MRRPALVAALALCCAASVQAAEGVAFADANGLVIVQVSVGDAPGTYAFVVDTGAQPCVVDDDLAASLDLELGGPRHGQGGAGEFVANHVVHPVRLGLPDGDQVRCVESIAIDLDEVGAGLGHRIDGVVGSDFFLGRRVRIDYDRRRVVRDAHRGRPPPAGTRIPLVIEGRRPYVDARLTLGPHRDVPRRLLLDTGSMDGVADELLDTAGAVTSEAKALGLGRGARVKLGRFDRVAIGPFAWDDVPATVGQVSIVGAGLLARYNLVIDYDERFIALLPRSRR
jgi:hypothetical protein